MEEIKREIMLYQAYKKVFGETAVSDFHTFTLPTTTDTDFTAIIFISVRILLNTNRIVEY